MPQAEAWLKEAQNDLLWAKDALASKLYSRVCFIAQQAAEKSLKSLGYFRGAERVTGHSIMQLAEKLEINGEIQEAGRTLDVYYISSRYPDALPDFIAPSDFFSEAQAVKAIRLANFIHDRVLLEIKKT